MGVRNNIKTWLSENRAPVSVSADLFPEIDMNYVRRKHDPKARGLEDGEKDLPVADATTFSSTELGLAGEFQQYQQEFIKRFNQHQLAYRERVQEIVQTLDVKKILNEEKEKINSVIAHSINDVADLDEKKMTMVGRATEFLNFRERNGLMSRLPDVRSLFRSLTILVVFYLAELLVTFLLTREAGNALTVMVVSLVYCTLNCAVPWFLASFCRPIYYRWDKWVAKLVGIFVSGAILACGGAMNLMMGHYRGVSMEIARESASIEFDSFAASEALMQRALGIGAETTARLWETPLALGEPQAFMLAAFGMLCFLASWHDGLVRDDKFPEYGKQLKLYSDAYHEYDLELNGVSERLIGAQRESVAHIEILKKEIIANLENLPRIMLESAGVTASCQNALVTVQANLDQLVAEYRMANQSKRSSAPPPYFDTQLALTPLTLNSPEFPHVEAEVGTGLLDILDEFADEIHTKYSEILSGLQDGPSILRQSENLRVPALTVEVPCG